MACTKRRVGGIASAVDHAKRTAARSVAAAYWLIGGHILQTPSAELATTAPANSPDASGERAGSKKNATTTLWTRLTAGASPSRWLAPCLASLMVAMGCATPSTARVVLDSDAVRNEVQHQRGMAVPRERSEADWHWMQLSQADLIRLSMPILEANADLCGEQVTTGPTGQRMCDYVPYYKADEAQVNAWTDGRNIFIAGGLVRFVQSEAELQAVVAHELAHITEGHIGKKRRNALMGALVGAVLDGAAAANNPYYEPTGPTMAESMGNIGAQSFSKRFEQEADYVSVYMLARAGVDTGAVASFWRRMGAADKANIQWGGSHPSTAKRYLAIEQAHQEVAAKLAAGCPLSPEPKAPRFGKKTEPYASCPSLRAAFGG